jgi:hypothetical protein
VARGDGRPRDEDEETAESVALGEGSGLPLADGLDRPGVLLRDPSLSPKLEGDVYKYRKRRASRLSQAVQKWRSGWSVVVNKKRHKK